MSLKQLFSLIYSDIHRRLTLEEKPIHAFNVMLAFCYRGVLSASIYRLKRYFYLKNHKVLNFFVWLLRFPEFYLCHNEIDPRAQIGEGLVLSDFGGVALGFTIILGKNCTFLGRATPTLGAMEDIKPSDKITIGDYCVIGHNVRIINPISVADGVQIKNNSVVITNIKAEGAILSGFPTKVLTTLPLADLMRWNPIKNRFLKV